MSARPQDNIAFLRAPENPVHALFIGPALESASQLFQRKVEMVSCDYADSLATGLSAILAQAKEKQFDCVVVDMRDGENGNPLNVAGIAASRMCGRLVVLANPDNASLFSNMVGVDKVLTSPVQPIDIVKTVIESTENSEHHDDTERSDPQPDISPDSAENWWDAGRLKSELKARLDPSLAAVESVDQRLWQRFVPLVSFLYKKLAIVLLGALFLTFLAYGAMIVFFMVNNSWSLPFELSRGHVLVEKMERDLSTLRLRRNQLRQDLTSAMADLENARRSKRDGELQLDLVRQTIKQELASVEAQRINSLEQINRLKKIVADLDRFTGKNGFARSLRNSYEKRLITKAAMNAGTLSLLETMHRLATMEGEISTKTLELRRHERGLTFLNSLLAEIDKPELKSVPSASSDLAHLAREVIQAKTQIASSQTTVESAKIRTARLENSHDVVSTTIYSLGSTPAARAILAPVTVLFVPYDNVDNLASGTPLYGCSLTIFACSQVGEIGLPIAGESSSVHPLFGKPMRGIFVEAEFVDQRSATSELVHARSAPLWF
jgi:hypothetical protein